MQAALGLIATILVAGGAVSLSGHLYARRATRIAKGTPYHPRHSEEPSGKPLDTEADATAFVGELRATEHETVEQLEAREWTDADYAQAFSHLERYLVSSLSNRLHVMLPADVVDEMDLYALRSAA